MNTTTMPAEAATEAAPAATISTGTPVVQPSTAASNGLQQPTLQKTVTTTTEQAPVTPQPVSAQPAVADGFVLQPSAASIPAATTTPAAAGSAPAAASPIVTPAPASNAVLPTQTTNVSPVINAAQSQQLPQAVTPPNQLPATAPAASPPAAAIQAEPSIAPANAAGQQPINSPATLPAASGMPTTTSQSALGKAAASPVTTTAQPLTVTPTTPAVAASAAALHPVLQNVLSSLPSEADSLIAYLARIPVTSTPPNSSNLPPNSNLLMVNNVAVVRSDELLPAVFAKLLNEKIVAAPVISPQGAFVGVIDNVDMLLFVLSAIAAQTPIPTAATDITQLLAAPNLAQATVADMLVMTQFRTKFIHSLQGFSLLHIVELIARTGAKVVPIIGADGSLAGLITQEMLIQFLAQIASRFGSIATIPVSAMLPILSQQVISIPETTATIDVLKALIASNCDAAAICHNETGSLLDTLTMNDLRGIGLDGSHLERLFQPVKVFKNIEQAEQTGKQPMQQCIVSPTSTLGDVIGQMISNNIHQVWLVQQPQAAAVNALPVLQPTHVITQRDVLTILLMALGFQ